MNRVLYFYQLVISRTYKERLKFKPQIAVPHQTGKRYIHNLPYAIGNEKHYKNKLTFRDMNKRQRQKPDRRYPVRYRLTIFDLYYLAMET